MRQNRRVGKECWPTINLERNIKRDDILVELLNLHENASHSYVTLEISCYINILKIIIITKQSNYRIIIILKIIEIIKIILTLITIIIVRLYICKKLEKTKEQR